MSAIEKHLGNSQITDIPRKKLSLKIGNGVITPEHLSDRILNEVIQPKIDYAITYHLGETIASIIQDLALQDYYKKREIDALMDEGYHFS